VIPLDDSSDVFTTDDARKALGISTVAARAVLRRVKARGEIADPHRGFHRKSARTESHPRTLPPD
jgi:hypothetical protein